MRSCLDIRSRPRDITKCLSCPRDRAARVDLLKLTAFTAASRQFITYGGNYFYHIEQTPIIVAMRLLERMDRACRLAHLARSTREQYRRWVDQFLRFHRSPDGAWRTPAELRGAEVAAFLTHMAVERRLSESSQNQA